MALVNEGYLHYREMTKFLKILLLRHIWSDFEMISQKDSLDDPFQKLLAKFLSFKKHGSGEWGLLAVWPWRNSLKFLFSEIVGQIVRWMTLFKICLQNFYSSRNMALVIGLLTPYRHEEIIKKSNRWSDFKIISQICSLDDPFENFFPKFWYLKKHGCDEGGYLHYMEMKKKILLLWNR